jgi:hypothetical protein
MAGATAMPGAEPARRTTIAEVWGDTLDVRHLGWAVLIGAVVSLAFFFVANLALGAVVSKPDLARAYAMLAGLGGCLVAGGICARLFAPKRKVVEHVTDSFWQEEVLNQLASEHGGLGSVSDLPAATVKEMKELELYDLFASHDRMDVETTAVNARPHALGANP